MDLERLAARKANLQRRAEILRLVRLFFYQRHFLEVETPLLASRPLPEAYIEPVATERGFLLPSPELYMKPLLAAGYGDIFQICHAFRKSEKGAQHREEFTLLEYYRVGAGYLDLAAETEDLVIFVAESLNGSSHLKYQGQLIDLSRPWQRLSVRQAFLTECGWDPVAVNDPERFDLDLATTVTGLSLSRPVILYDFPASAASLAKIKPGDDRVAERTEIFIGGLELANIFTELTDPVEQRQRFNAEIELARRLGRKTDMPENFLTALEHLPEAAGGALGIDRLAMLFCNSPLIEDVMALAD